MEKAKTRIVIEQANGDRREFECEGYVAMLFDCERVTEDGEAEATVLGDHVSVFQIAAVMTHEDNPFYKAMKLLEDMKGFKLPWSM